MLCLISVRFSFVLARFTQPNFLCQSLVVTILFDFIEFCCCIKYEYNSADMLKVAREIWQRNFEHLIWFFWFKVSLDLVCSFTGCGLQSHHIWFAVSLDLSDLVCNLTGVWFAVSLEFGLQSHWSLVCSVSGFGLQCQWIWFAVSVDLVCSLSGFCSSL